MGLYDTPDRAALNMLARAAMRSVQMSETLATMTKSTVYTGTLSVAPIMNSKKQFIGLYGDSGFTPDGTIFKTEKSTADAVTADGDYFIDYMTGYYKVKAGATGTPTVTWYILALFMLSPYAIAFTSALTVTVTHNLGYIPFVQVLDSGGNVIVGDVKHNSINEFVVTFAEAQTGTVYYR